ncbi:MAG: hypothetical protein P8X57_03890, partial [Cyclobacteriaceae bacterium]
MMNSRKIKVGILGCGWLGTAAGKYLSSNGYIVWGTTTQSSKLNILREAGINPLLLEIGNRNENQPPVLPDTDFLILSMSPAITWQERHTLSRMIRASGAQAMLLTSSTSVYPPLNGPVAESDADYIKSAHSGIVLLSLEDHFRNIANLSVTVFRFAGLYGPGREPGKFLMNRQLVDGGDTPVNLVHQEDCIRAIMHILDNHPASGTYNICADKHPKRKEFYTKAADNLGLKPPRFSEEPVDYKIVDNRLFKKTYQFEYI